MTRKRSRSGVLLLLLCCAPATTASGQESVDNSAVAEEPPANSAELSGPVAFTARDSLVVGFGDADIGSLFGSATVNYEKVALTAFRIDMLFDADELHASALPTDSGLVGMPQFQQQEETFSGSNLAFNLRTERGRIVDARTQIQEGFVRAEVVKARQDSTLFIRNGAYTTCECIENPSYSLRSTRMKVVNQKWIYTGPIQLYLFNIPTPLWLPFGFLPAQDGRRSGPLPPTYGEDQFGFYLRDWGWYFALNDFMDLQLQGGLWTRGSFEGRALFRYSRRYRYNGQLALSLARFRSGERGDPGFSIRRTSSFRWNHRQTLSPSASFDANVNLSSSGFLRGVSQNYGDRVTQTIQSSVRYAKRWRSRSLTLNATQRQVVSTGAASLGLPDVSFSQNSFKPFQRTNRPPGSSERFYERLTLSYNMSANNRFDFNPLSDQSLFESGDSAATDIGWIDALLSQDDYRRATGKDERFKFKATHRIPVSAPFSVEHLPLLGDLRVNLSPSLSYTEDWYVRTDRRALNDSTGVLESSSVPGFFALRQYTASVSASSVFYGIFPLRLGRFSGLRHTARPSIGFGYRPDFYASGYGYTRSYLDAEGQEVRYAIAPGVSNGLQQSVTFSLANTFETKRIQPDSSTAAAPRPLKLLDMNMASSYNFAADSLGFGGITLSARTRILGKVDVDFRSNYSPYKTGENGGIINRTAFSLRTPLGRLTSASLTIRTSLRSKNSQGASRPLTTPRAGFSGDPMQASSPLATTLQQPFGMAVADFAIPWSLSMDFTYGVNRSAFSSTRRAVVNASFDFSVTPNWKITGRTGYDIDALKLATTSLAVARDFDCWQMAFSWIPVGVYQSWGFDLHVKSSALRDILRIRQPKSDIRDRFGSL
jgi:lipopolysaccharide assembly outer membrane protein LptD (OstA)